MQQRAMMTDLGFTPNENQKRLLERIQRGETILINRPRRYGWSHFNDQVRKMLKHQAAPHTNLSADIMYVDESTETNTEAENENSTRVAA